ncbi:MAG: MBL fold metallo-hydrolase [Puniceicoccales bacterium]
MIAHDSEGCDLANPKNWRTRSSIHVTMGGHHIQVDAAPEFRLQCLRHQIEWIDTFILTHPHADHVMGMDDLRRFCDLRDYEAMPVFSTGDGIARIGQIFPYAISDRAYRKGYPAFALHEMPAVLETPGGTIRRFLLPHGSIQTLGLVFEEKDTGAKFAYFCDCKEVPPEARAAAEGAQVVVLDGLRPEPHPTHMSIFEAIETAKEIAAPAAYLTHFTFHIDHDSWTAQLPENIHLAYDGLRLTL